MVFPRNSSTLLIPDSFRTYIRDVNADLPCHRLRTRMRALASRLAST